MCLKYLAPLNTFADYKMQVLFLGYLPSDDFVSKRILVDSVYILKNLPCQASVECKMRMELGSIDQRKLFSEF